METKARKLTPMLEQYLSIKRQYPDALLFYRMGDFYEMFFEDAVRAAPLLEVQLTARDKSAADPIPMCGVPHHAVQNYIQKLLNHGQKVAICEQLEDPAVAKGVVKRDVIRVITPALIADPELVSDESECWLLAICPVDGEIDVCALDLFSGRRLSGRVASPRQLNETFIRYSPREVLFSGGCPDHHWFGDLKRLGHDAAWTRRDDHFPVGAADPAHQAALAYLRETQKRDELGHLEPVAPLFAENGMWLDATTVATLEINRSAKGSLDGPTLFNTVNFTCTPMGRRLLREWLSAPLASRESIEARLDALDELYRDATAGEALREVLRDVRDLERLTTKTALGLAMPRDLAAIREVLAILPALKQRLEHASSSLLKKMGTDLDPLDALAAHLRSALEETPAATVREGGIFRDGFHPEIAEFRSLARDAKSTIAAMEQRERERTGISNLKIRYNKVFGYTIEVSKTHVGRVPADYIRKQTISTGERYITEELKAFEEKALTAEHRLRALEERLFLELRSRVAEDASALLADSRCLASLDVLLAFARAAREHGYRRPELHDGWELSIEDGRHPVVENILGPGNFVPNSIALDPEECRTILITGPNMAGKSTIMRQVALISILAQAGSFVPAKRARLPVMDAIFTRIGSGDDLAGGRSTFMVEMTEVARILQQATERSLILIDEIGRGTSTYDGLSLAWSLIEHIHTAVRAKTLFSTHFHEITALESTLPAVRNFNVLVEKWEGDIVFLHRLAPGICNRSYGIEVAGLAALPPAVLSRAAEILGGLEARARDAGRLRSGVLKKGTDQLTFF